MRARMIGWPKGRMKRLQIEELAAYDPREVPMYWLADVALFTGVPESTLKRWIGQISDSKALIQPPPDRFQQHDREARLSFNNLLEAHILDATRKHNIPIVRVRSGLDYLRNADPGASHPLLANTFYSVAGLRDMFIKTVTGDAVNISRHGQPALGQILDEHLKRIEWDKSGPVRLRPMRSEHVVIDLNVSGGQPVIKGTGVLATILTGRWRAGDTYDELAQAYALPVDDVREAVRYIEAA